MPKWLWETGRRRRLYGVTTATIHYTGRCGAPTCGARSRCNAEWTDQFLVLVSDRPADVTCEKCKQKVRVRLIGRRQRTDDRGEA